MKTITIGKRITLAFLGSFLIAATVSLFCYVQLRLIATHSKQLARTSMSGIFYASQIQHLVRDNELLLTRHLICKNDEVREDIESNIHTNVVKLADYCRDYVDSQSAITNTEAASSIRAFIASEDEYVKSLETAISLSKQDQLREAMELKTGKLDKAKEVFDAVAYTNKKEGDAAALAIERSVTKSVAGVAIGMAVMLVASVLIGWLLIRSTSTVLKAVVDHLVQSVTHLEDLSSQIAQAAQDLATGSDQQAVSVQETSGFLRELEAKTSHNAGNSERTKGLSGLTRSAAEAGTQDVQEMCHAMAEVKGSSNNISVIIKTIDEIAFQTNILSLNASVEAARAGSAGMGFAVVANEVRNLAQRSAVAAKETAHKIEDSIHKSNRGAEISSKVITSLDSILEKAKQVDQLVGQINDDSREQFASIQRITQAMSRVDDVARRNTQTAERTTATAESLNGQSRELGETVSRLMVLLEGQPLGPAKEGLPPATNLPKRGEKPLPASRSAHLNIL